MHREEVIGLHTYVGRHYLGLLVQGSLAFTLLDRFCTPCGLRALATVKNILLVHCRLVNSWFRLAIVWWFLQVLVVHYCRFGALFKVEIRLWFTILLFVGPAFWAEWSFYHWLCEVLVIGLNRPSPLFFNYTHWVVQSKVEPWRAQVELWALALRNGKEVLWHRLLHLWLLLLLVELDLRVCELKMVLSRKFRFLDNKRCEIIL